MRSAATNWVDPADSEASFVTSESQNVVSNENIEVAGMNRWQRKAIGKVLEYKWRFDRSNWDSYGSKPINQWVIEAACKLVQIIPFDNIPAPRVVPVSGGGIQIEWSKGARDLEIYIRPDQSVEILKIEDGVPLNEGEELMSIYMDVESVFSWLNAAKPMQ